MRVHSVPLFRALHWLNAGWRYFSSNIGAWLAMSILFFISAAILIIIPRAGIFLLVFLLPVFFAGLLHAADRSQHGISPQVENIVHGFNLQPPGRNLFLLGGLMLLYLFGLILILYPFSGVLFQSLYAIHMTEQHTLPTLYHIALQFTHQHPLILWAQLLTIIGGLAVFAYAIPLTLFDGVHPLKAMALSLQAFVHNLVPVSMLFGLSLLLVGMASFAFGIGFLVLLPVLVGANYASYREIFVTETERLAPA